MCKNKKKQLFPPCYLVALKSVTIPYLNRVISQARNNFVIVVLKTVHALGILGSTIDSLQIVIARTPVVLNRIDVLRMTLKSD